MLGEETKAIVMWRAFLAHNETWTDAEQTGLKFDWQSPMIEVLRELIAKTLMQEPNHDPRT
jgi:hypothetical protein